MAQGVRRDNHQYGKCFEVLTGLIQVSRRPPCPVTSSGKYSTPKMMRRSMAEYLPLSALFHTACIIAIVDRVAAMLPPCPALV